MFENWTGENIDAFYLISQLFALTALTCDLIAVQLKKKSSLLKMDTLAAFFSFLHYAFLGAWAGMVSKIITTARNGIAAREATLNHKSSKVLPLIFVGLYVLLGCFTFESPFSLLPIIAPSFYAIVIYTCDVKKVRYAALTTNIIWLIYNVFVFSIAGIVSQIVLIINSSVAIYRYRKKKKKIK